MKCGEYWRISVVYITAEGLYLRPFLLRMFPITFNVLLDFQGFWIDVQRAQFAVLYSILQRNQRFFIFQIVFEQQLKLRYNAAGPKNKKKY